MNLNASKGSRMKKICPGCGQERDAEKDFRWRYKDRGIRQPRCRYCQQNRTRPTIRITSKSISTEPSLATTALLRKIKEDFTPTCPFIPASIAVKLMCAFLSLTMYEERSYAISLCY